MQQNIKLIEEGFNIRFPSSYVNFVLNSTNNSKYKFIMDDGGGQLGSETMTFLNFNEESEDYILNVCKEEEHLEPNNLIPFARTEWEFDFICFYFDSGRKQEPKVIYFSFDLHYESLEDAIFYISNSFEEFISKLVEV